MKELAHYCAGESTNPDRILQHIETCSRCAVIVEDALESASKTGPAFALSTSTPDGKRRTAALLASALRRPTIVWRYGAVAAGVLAVGAGLLWWYSHATPGKDALLARAYTATRPFEYRLPDEGYGPVRQVRGGSPGSAPFDRPDSLVEAEAAIRRQLARQPKSAEALLSKGRAELLERDYAGAIDSLTGALEFRAGDPDIPADLGCAYALRGDAERRSSDYGAALERLLEAQKTRPSDPRILFNLAIVYERLWLVDEAIDALERMLAGKNEAGWSGEARMRLAALEKIRTERKKAEDRISHDPARFLAEAEHESGFDPDLYHETFWTDWLSASSENRQAREVIDPASLGRFVTGSLLVAAIFRVPD